MPGDKDFNPLPEDLRSGPANSDTITRLIKLFADQSWYTRKIAADRIIEIGAESIDYLFPEVQNHNEDVRYWVYKCLGEINTEQAISFLLEKFHKSNKVDRNYVVLAFGSTDDKRVIPLLIEALNDESWIVCSNAARSLVKKGDYIVELLVESLKKSNYNVAYWITKVLSRLGPKGINVLMTFLRFRNKNVRTLVAEALADAKDISVVPQLVDCLKDDSWAVQESAADALVALGDNVVEPLLCLLKDEREIHDWTDKIFERLGQKRVPPLIRLLKHNNREVRIRAAEALGNTGAAESVSPLIDTLHDKVWLVRKVAAKALAQLGPIAVDELIRSLKTEDENVRYWITVILGKIGDTTLDPLIRILNTGTREMRSLAAQALGETRDHRAIRPLIEAMRDEAWIVRNSAASSLKEIRGDAIFQLIKVIMAQDENLRFWSRKIIQEIGEYEVDKFIHILKTEENPEMRYFAAYGLSIIKSQRAIEPLSYALLNDSDDWVRKYCATALGEICQKDCIRPIILALDTENNELALWITKILGKMGDLATGEIEKLIASQDERFRLFGTIALAETGDKQALSKVFNQLRRSDLQTELVIRALASVEIKDISVFTNAIKSGNPTMRENIVRVMTKIGEDILPKLEQEVKESEDKELIHWLTKAIREIKSPKIRLKR